MKLPTFGILAKALTLGFILILGYVGESHGSHGSPKDHGKGYGGSHGSPKDHEKHSHGSPNNHNNQSPGSAGSPTGSSPSIPSGLQVGFYKGLCPNKAVDVEALIATQVQEEFHKDPTILPALLRMQFHDCFVHGCDASILIAGNSTEKKAGANLSVRGFEFIDAVKVALEAQCPDIVSCADIIAVATKVLIKLGGGPDYPVQTGRRDGVKSNTNDVDLPSPFMTVSQTISVFAAKRFTSEEMVILLGGHTVGVAQCGFFQDRVHNGTSQFDPNMDRDLRKKLMLTCPSGTTSNNVAFLDQNPQSSNKVDNSFYNQIIRNKGILPIDQALARDPQTSGIVQQLSSNANLFSVKFASAMVKLQALDVLTGNQGEIRKVCSKFN